MHSVSFEQICTRLRSVVFPEVDLVLGIGRGGTVPAALTAFMLNRPLKMISVNYRDDNNDPCRSAPELLSDLVLPQKELNILIVDDVAVTGRTLESVSALVTGKKVTTFVFKGAADIVLFTEFEKCVRWPWNVLKERGD